MRALTRLPEPQILQQRGAAWLAAFLASGKARPDSTKYANAQIKAQLNSMSFHKCFYCEVKLKNKPKEVDHQIEVSVNNTLSYTWTNLYLACDNCNGKIDHATIPITNALDPCRNTNLKIENHLTFNDEQITAKKASALGLETIKKYRLDTELLDKRRIDQLKIFQKLLISIQQNIIAQDRNSMTLAEKQALQIFKQPDQPFSLMFKIILAQYNL
jgi:5-methylcytosine-specific restriction endonuclease McrA